MANSEKVKEMLEKIKEDLLNMPREELVKLIEDTKKDLDPRFIDFCNGIFPSEPSEVEHDFLKYIGSQKYYCCYCKGLQDKILANGLEEIKKYNGMVCSGVEDLQLRYYSVLDGKSHDIKK